MELNSHQYAAVKYLKDSYHYFFRCFIFQVKYAVCVVILHYLNCKSRRATLFFIVIFSIVTLPSSLSLLSRTVLRLKW